MYLIMRMLMSVFMRTLELVHENTTASFVRTLELIRTIVLVNENA